MKRVAWRQNRLELIIGLVVLAGLAAFLVPVGLQKLTLFRDLGLANMTSNAAEYDALSIQFLNSYQSLNPIMTTIFFVPGLIGALFAAPIILEFEQRTYRLAWTQSVTRGHWLATKLGLALTAVVAFSAALSILVTWWFAPQERLINPFANFNLHGIVPVAYAVFVLAVALAVGAWIKRTGPALIVALVVFFVAVMVISSGLRSHYMTPAEQLVTFPVIVQGNGFTSSGAIYRGWVLEDYPVDASGNPLSQQQLQEMCNNSTRQDSDTCLYSQGVREFVKYQPADRYWPFQGIEASVYMGTAAVLLGTTVWVVKRRMT